MRSLKIYFFLLMIFFLSPISVFDGENYLIETKSSDLRLILSNSIEDGLNESLDFNKKEYLIKIKLSDLKLILLDNAGNELLNFPIAGPQIMPKKLPFEGFIEKIERNPYWFPTDEIREEYFKKHSKELPKIIKPGDPRNMMGIAKIIIRFTTPGINPTIRIHAAIDENSIGQRVTRDCIRLKTKDINFLITLISDKQIKVRFEM